MSGPLGLFEAYGVELEYMLVDRETLAVLPAADRLLAAAEAERAGAGGPGAAPSPETSGGPPAEVEMGPLCWSNELVLHVVELKTGGPAATLAGLAGRFQESVARATRLLEPLGARLMPTGMHPWLDPERETRLWPHEGRPVYRAYDRIFGCRGHGWANLQSAHLNLPFAGDDQFARLHAAIRLVLPILPALAASSPVVEGRVTGLLDHRLEVYRTNSRRFASVAGRVIPEPVYTRAAYEAEILEPIYRDLAPLDPEGVLRDEFANARGAIARFGRGSIEIRLLDVQEAPRADLAVIALVAGVLRLLVAEHWSGLEDQARVETEPLARLLERTIRTAEETRIDDPGYLAHFGLRSPTTAAGLWHHLVVETAAERVFDPREHGSSLGIILRDGPLARRILAALGPEPGRGRQEEVYRRLCECLEAGEMFVG